MHHQKNSIIKLGLVFDTNYASQAMAMVQSASKNSSLPITWYALILDELTPLYLPEYDNTSIIYLRPEDLNDREFISSRNSKPWREFCWSSASVLLNWMTLNLDEGDLLGYVDSDCFFLSDPRLFLEPLIYNKGDILIHEHNYSIDRLDWLKKSGRFNVGFIAGLNTSKFKSCISLWRMQVLEDSSINYEKGICGDQKYLDQWPNLFPTLIVNENIGAGVAPWNVNNYSFSWKGPILHVNEQPVIFYHFHGLQTIKISHFVFYLIAPGYKIDIDKVKKLYKLYLEAIVSISQIIGFDKKHMTKIDFIKSAIRSRSFPRIARPGRNKI